MGSFPLHSFVHTHILFQRHPFAPERIKSFLSAGLQKSEERWDGYSDLWNRWQSNNFFFYFILLYNTVLVLPYINMNPPRVYTCSQSWTPLPPPSPYRLSGSSQCTSPKHPVSCIKPELVIHFIYDIIHVSMPFSQIIPTSPSLTESKSLFYTCVSFAVSHAEL